MPDKVVIARFDGEADAMLAARTLEASGISAAPIRRQTGGPASEPSDQNAGSVWDWLLGEESPVSDKSLWRGGSAAKALAVTVPETESEATQTLMREHGARQVEEYPARA